MADKSVMIEIRGDIADINAKLKGLSGSFQKSRNQGTKAFDGVNQSLARMSKGIKVVAGMVVGLFMARGGARLAGSFLEAAKTSEEYRTRLEVLLGSQAEGNKLFKEMADYASKVPFEYEKIMSAATQLSGVMTGGVDEIKKWMPLIGDLAAASGLSIEDTTMQIVRMYSAGAGAADLFRDRGISAMLGFKAGVSYTAEETREQLMRMWKDPTSKFAGATTKLADDWTGLTSMMGDKWFAFRNKVMDSAIFDVLKEGLKGVLDEIDTLKEKGKLDEWANAVGIAFVESMRVAATAVREVVQWVNLLNIGIDKIQAWSYGKFIEDYRAQQEELESKIAAVEAGGLEAVPSIERITNDWKTAEKAVGAYKKELADVVRQIQGLREKQISNLDELAAGLEKMEDIDAKFGSLIQYFNKAKQAIKEPITPTADPGQVEEVWKNIYGHWKRIKVDIEGNPIKVIMELKTKGSPVMGFTEGIDYAKGKLNELASVFTQVMDLGGITGLAESYMAMFRQSKLGLISSTFSPHQASQAVARESAEIAQTLKRLLDVNIAQLQGQGGGNTYNVSGAGGDARELAFEIQRLQEMGQAPSLGY